MKVREQKGFTLVELVTVLALISILGATALYAMNSHLKRARLRSAAEIVAAEMRQAWWRARAQSISCSIIFDTEQQTYIVSGSQRAALPKGIRFGVDPTVVGRPSSPYEAPPEDGVSFDSGSAKNRTHFQPTGTVSPTGSLYLTDGKETMAVTVAITGRPKIWKSLGGRKWVSL